MSRSPGQRSEPQASSGRPGPPPEPPCRRPAQACWCQRPVEVDVGELVLDFRRRGMLRIHPEPAELYEFANPGRVDLTLEHDDHPVRVGMSGSSVRLLAYRLLAASAENAFYVQRAADPTTLPFDDPARLTMLEIDTMLEVDALASAQPCTGAGAPGEHTGGGEAEGCWRGQPVELEVDRLVLDCRGRGVLRFDPEPAELYELAHPGQIYLDLDVAEAADCDVGGSMSASQARLLAYRLLAASAENAFYVEEARYRAEQSKREADEQRLREIDSPAERLREFERQGFVLDACDRVELGLLDRFGELGEGGGR
jgi:hypothetical protein